MRGVYSLANTKAVLDRLTSPLGGQATNGLKRKLSILLEKIDYVYLGAKIVSKNIEIKKNLEYIYLEGKGAWRGIDIPYASQAVSHLLQWAVLYSDCKQFYRGLNRHSHVFY